MGPILPPAWPPTPLNGEEANLLIDAGSTYMHEEVSELMGCSNTQAQLTVNEEVAADILGAIDEAKALCFEGGLFSLGYRNFKGGLYQHRRKVLRLPDQIRYPPSPRTSA